MSTTGKVVFLLVKTASFVIRHPYHFLIKSFSFPFFFLHVSCMWPDRAECGWVIGSDREKLIGKIFAIVDASVHTDEAL